MSRRSSIVVILVTVLCWPVFGEDCRFPDCVEPGYEDLPIIWGTVVDDQGAELPGVTVTISQPGFVHFRITDGRGHFLFENVEGGFWDMSVEISGFADTSLSEVLSRGLGDEGLIIVLVPQPEEIGKAPSGHCAYCREAPSIDIFDKPSCEETRINSELIERSENGDLVATAELQQRFALTMSLRERQRMADELIRRVETDDVYLDFLRTDAARLIDLTIHAPLHSSSNEPRTPFEDYATDAGLDKYELSSRGLHALSILSSQHDDRLISLLLRALESRDESIAAEGFFGLAGLGYQAAAPRILAAIERGELDPSYVWPYLYLFDDVALRTLADAASADDERRDEQVSWMKDEYPWMRLPGEE